MTEFISPEQIMIEARQATIDGRKPGEPIDWMRIIVYMSHRIDENLAVAAIQLIMSWYNCPLQNWEIASICRNELDVMNLN